MKSILVYCVIISTLFLGLISLVDGEDGVSTDTGGSTDTSGSTDTGGSADTGGSTDTSGSTGTEGSADGTGQASLPMYNIELPPGRGTSGGVTGQSAQPTDQQVYYDNDEWNTDEGQDNWDTSEVNYVTQRPDNYNNLTEIGTVQGSNTQAANGQVLNGLWIVDSTGLNHYPEMSIPLSGCAKEEITPGVDGEITMEEMYPDGTVRTYGLGYVRANHVYSIWFCGDVAGTHKTRYSVNGYYSNIVRFYVQGSQSQNQGASAPAASSSSTTTSSTNKIVRNGGSVSHSSSSMSVSSGSMSISTSFG